VTIQNKETAMTHLSGHFEIKGWEEKPFEEHDDGRKTTRATVKRSFAGDLSGESSTEYLMAYAADQTARFVGMEIVEGEVDGQTGHLTLALTGVYDGKEAKADWEVVEGSGDGVFANAEGKGSFSAPHGSTGEYKLTLKLPKVDPPLILI
jgi:hypothetical protein